MERQYDQVWNYYRQMIDWRYKFLTGVLGIWSGLMIACGWLWINQLPAGMIVVGLVGAVVSFTAWKMELRTVAIIGDCEDEGSKLEQQLGRQSLFARLASNIGKPLPYDKILPRIYFWLAVAWVAWMVAACFLV